MKMTKVLLVLGMALSAGLAHASAPADGGLNCQGLGAGKLTDNNNGKQIADNVFDDKSNNDGQDGAAGASK